MGYTNNMTNLLNKIENRLGTKPLNLPDDIKKETWASNVIELDTLVTFSRYFPRMFKYEINPTTHPRKQGLGGKELYFILDEEMLGPDIKILGVRDLSWANFAEDSLTYQQNMGLGVYDYIANSFGVSDVSLMQMRADHMSLFNNGIFVDFEPPNMIKLTSSTNADISRSVGKFTVDLFIQHRADLTTISPTQMETFEALAQADVALYLYRYLQRYDQLETVYAQIDLKLGDLEQEAGKREDIINTLKEAYVSAANKNQPIMYVQ